MATVTKPIALDESFNTTELTPRNIADVLAEELSRITGRNALQVEYDNTESGLDADNVQDALDEINGKIPTVPSVDIQTAVDEFETYNGGILSSLKVALTPNQDLHGYDHPWVGGAGKNLWGGNVTVNNVFSNAFPIDVGENSVTISLKNASGKQINCRGYDENGSVIIPTFKLLDATDTSGSYTLALTQKTYINIVINGGADADIPNVTEVQIEKGSTATDYESYENICPISGHTQAVVGDDGINLINGIENGAVDDYGSPSTSAYRCRTVEFTHIKPNTQYTLKALSDDGTLEYLVRTFEDADGSYRISDNDGWHQGAFTFTSQANAHDLKVIFRFSDNASIDASQIYNVQLELGSTATAYVPYNGYQVTVNFGGTYYSGTLDIVTGVFTPNTASVDLGTLTWTYDSGTQRFTSSVTGLKNLPVRTAPMTCEVYKVIDDGRAIADVPDGSIYNGNMSANVYVHDSRFTVPSDLATALSGYKLVYPLATPTPIQLIPTPAKALVGENHLSAPLEGQEITESKYRQLFTWDEVEAYVNAHSGSGSGMNYSTEEQVVGTWIDSKPLYQKTIDFGALPNANTKDLSHGIANIDKVWISGGFAYQPNGDFANQLSLCVPSSLSAGWYFGVNSSIVRCETASDRTNYSAYVTIQYTKTTD